MDIRMRDVPEQVVVTEQRMVDQPALVEWLPGAMSRVHEATAGAWLGTAGAGYLLRDEGNEPIFVVIYEGNPNEGSVAVEACAPLASGSGVDDAPTRTVPAHREAYVRVTKGTVESGGLGDVYMGIEKWINDNGYEIVAAPRETYWTDFYDAGPDDEVFDVSFPVR
jgi:hypothetical protein